MRHCLLANFSIWAVVEKFGSFARLIVSPCCISVVKATTQLVVIQYLPRLGSCCVRYGHNQTPTLQLLREDLLGVVFVLFSPLLVAVPECRTSDRLRLAQHAAFFNELPNVVGLFTVFGRCNPSLVALLVLLRSLIRSRVDFQLENVALRHQVGVLQRSLKKRRKITAMDRLFWASLSRIWRDWRSALVIVKPQTVVSWHRTGFRLFWTWKVQSRPDYCGLPAQPISSQRLWETTQRWSCPDSDFRSSDSLSRNRGSLRQFPA